MYDWKQTVIGDGQDTKSQWSRERAGCEICIVAHEIAGSNYRQIYLRDLAGDEMLGTSLTGFMDDTRADALADKLAEFLATLAIEKGE